LLGSISECLLFGELDDALEQPVMADHCR